MKIQRIILATIFGILCCFNYSQAIVDNSEDYMTEPLPLVYVDIHNDSLMNKIKNIPNYYSFYKNPEVLIISTIALIIFFLIILYLNISNKRKIILFFLTLSILYLILFIFFNAREISYVISKNKIPTSFERLTFNKQEISRSCELSKILEEELSQPYLSNLLFANRYYIEFDYAATYTLWLYAEVKPSKEQADFIATEIGRKLISKYDSYYFNFEIFPKNSEKIPGDNRLSDSYFSPVYRGE